MLTPDERAAINRARAQLHVDAQTAALTWNILWRAPIVNPHARGPLDPRAMTRSLALTQSVDSDAFRLFQ